MTDPRDTLKRAAELLREHFNLKSEVAAALDRMAEQEPVYVEQWNHGCNALCTGIDLWIPRCPHCGKPAPNTVPVAPADDARDAARYRWLREQNNNRDTIGARIAIHEYGMDWDAAIDAATAETTEKEASK